MAPDPKSLNGLDWWKENPASFSNFPDSVKFPPNPALVSSEFSRLSTAACTAEMTSDVDSNVTTPVSTAWPTFWVIFQIENS